MKRLVFLFLALFLLFLPPSALADDSWLIENYHSDIAIQQSGVVRVVETISVDFKDNPKHGIYRDIPYLYEDNGKQTYTDVQVESVLQGNVPVQYTITQTNGYEELKIGNPDQTLMGRTAYTITYTVTGVLRGVSDHDELYWNVTGNNWPVEIQKADAFVTLPQSGISHITCYEGPSGSQTPCQSTTASPQVATFATTNSLAESEGLTVAIAYQKGLVPLLTAKPPKSYWEKLLEWPSIGVFLIILLGGVGSVFYFWYKYGRDYWFANVLFGTKEQQGKVKPIGAHETISVEFTPPENLRPAEIGVLMDERADTHDITATIIDLATRGYLTVTEVQKKWLFGETDYLLTKKTPKALRKTVSLLPYEQLLLDKLFYKRSQVKLSSLKTTFYQELREVKQALYDDVVSKQLFPADPEQIRSKYLGLSVLLLSVGIILTILGFTQGIVLLGEVSLAVVFTGVLFLVTYRYMPRKTAYGRELYRRSKGYYLFIDKAEKYRQRYFEKENMFNDVLPYAVMFGLTKRFAKQMEKIGLEPTQTDWYVSSHPFAMGVFIGSVNSFSSSMSLAIASTPSSSGGFSGGSSGGGFGGGGGGSW